MHVANEEEGDRVLARKRELVDSVTQMMVGDEIYDGKPWIYISEQELKKGLQTFAGVDVQQTSDVDFCRRIFRVLKMDASVPVDSGMFMQKRPLRKYLADSGLKDVVKPGGRQYTLKHGKVLLEVISAGIMPLEVRRKVEREAGKRERGVTLDQWLLRGPSCRAMLLTNTTQARVPRPLG